MKTRKPPVPTLAQRALELRALPFTDSRIEFCRGRKLRYHFSISPGRYGRLYECVLEIFPSERVPRMFVMRPSLVQIAQGVRPPHLYDHDGNGCLLCLWWPKNYEFDPRQKLAETYIAWTADWLWYFEEWLKHGKWLAGGVHPIQVPRKWGRGRTREAASVLVEEGVTP